MKPESDQNGILPLALAEVFETMPDGALVLDAQQRVIALNAAARRILGLPDDQAIGQTARELAAGLADCFPPRQPASALLMLGSGEAHGQYEVTVSPVAGQAGEPAGHLAVLRRRALETLGESEPGGALLDAIPDTLLRLTRDGEIVDFKGRDELGQPAAAEKLVGRHIREWLPPKAVPLMLDYIALALDTQQPQEFEYLVPGAGRAGQHYETRLSASGAGEVVAIVRNVSERARLEQMKSDFIHRAAHDLRTPLTTALLAASIIQEGGTPEELEQYWKILRTELGRQRELIEELLTMGRLESGSFQLSMVPVEVAPLLQEAVESVKPLAEKRGVTFTSRVAADLPPVTADKNGLKQVFVNLLDNAVKFSPPGQTVELSAACHDDGAAVAVRDHGMGVPAEELPKLFDRFYRASNAVRNEVQGTGVGLFIAKAVVDQLKGRISVDSRLDEGTTFEVRLPRRKEG